MYVWLDALTNYITGVGYPDGGDEWTRAPGRSAAGRLSRGDEVD